jgi:hypothetical protein
MISRLSYILIELRPSPDIFPIIAPQQF